MRQFYKKMVQPYDETYFYLIERDGEQRITGRITEGYLASYSKSGWFTIKRWGEGEERVFN